VSGFQAAAAVAVLHARRETEARLALADANAELVSARAILAQHARTDERERIARELHDTLGHTLTALGLQLEVARNVGAELAPEHVSKAQALATEALAGVRSAVSAMRSTAGADLARLLQDLCGAAPGLCVHLALPPTLVVDCTARAHCVVRCVQEILTNALRHAEARNLWIVVTQSRFEITIDARDDGRGAPLLVPGNGLAGMRSRLEEMGGGLVIAATPAFSLSARLPLGEPA
jgi:signal transduction histidine kinase